MALSSFGQNLYKYTYDASGNRTIRNYPIGISITAEEEGEEEVQTFSRMLSAHEITLQTTETENEIVVRVNNMSSDM